RRPRATRGRRRRLRARARERRPRRARAAARGAAAAAAVAAGRPRTGIHRRWTSRVPCMSLHAPPGRIRRQMGPIGAGRSTFTVPSLETLFTRFERPSGQRDGPPGTAAWIRATGTELAPLRKAERKGGTMALELTLLDLVKAVSDNAATEAEVVSTVVHL